MDNKQKLKQILLKSLKTIITIILIVVVVVVVFASSYFLIMNGFSKKVGETMKNSSVKYDTENGAIIIEDEQIKELESAIDSVGIYKGNLNLTDEQLKKIYAAEVVTNEINRGFPEEDGKYYGRIYVKRANGTTENLEDLKYIDYEEFEKLGASEILNYFSIQEDKLCIANTLTEKDAEGNQKETINIQKIEYKDNLKGYMMPVEFLLDLALFTQNPEFVMDLTDRVLNETKIIIAIMQEKNTSTTETKYTYNIETETTIKYENYDSNDRMISKSLEGPIITKQNGPAPQITTTTETSINSVAKIIYAKNWFLEEEYKYNKTSNTYVTEIPEDDPSNLIEEKPFGKPETTKNESREFNEDGTYSIITKKVRKRLADEKQSVKITENDETYTESITESKGQVNRIDEFIKLLRTNYKSGMPIGKILDGSEILLKMLQNSERTQTAEQIMRYVLYRYTGNSYGVTDLELDIFAIRDFNSVSTSGGALLNYIMSWENTAAWKSKVGKYLTTKDGEYYYIVYEDGTSKHNTISYGLATFIADSKNGKVTHQTYGKGYYNLQEEFSSYGIDVTTLKTGDLVKKDSADAIFTQVINDIKQKVDQILLENGITLEQSQRDALVAVYYQYGNIGNFTDAYKKCGNTESLKSEFKTAGGASPFYGDTDRKKANWNLFNTGKYIARDGTEIPSGILDIADKIHKYMEQNNYKYCVYFCNSYEEHSNNAQCGLNRTFEASKTGYHSSCCATYVSWVLQEAGYIVEAEHTNGAYGIEELLVRKGWTKIQKVSDLQPGDILFYGYGHVEIYAGDGKVYNAGSGSAIRGASPAKRTIPTTGEYKLSYGLRAPN